MWKRTVPWLAILGILFVACSSGATPNPQPTATPTKAPPATAGPTAASPGATPTSTPVAKATTAPTAEAKPKYGGTLRIHLRRTMTAWDPQAQTGNTHIRIQTQVVFSPLVVPEWPAKGVCEKTIVPNLATSWQWLDSTTLEIKLNQGVKFHNKPPVNGRELTADDVVWSFNRLKEVQSGLALLMNTVSRIEAVDRYTVRFRTTAPSPAPVPDALGSWLGPLVFPKEAATAKGFTGPETYIGSGPFQMKVWQPGVKVSYERNPDYFKKGFPYLDGIDYLDMPDRSTQIAAFRAGKLDWLPELPIPFVEELERSHPETPVVGCPSWIGFLKIIWRTDTAPFNDVRVRRAISMGIDRQALLKTVMLGRGSISGVLPSNAPYSIKPADFPDEVRKYIEYHPDEAKKLLAEAGFPNGFETTYYASTQYGWPFTDGMEALIPMLQAIGLKIKPLWMERAAWLEVSNEGKYDTMGAMRVADLTENVVGLPNNLHSQSPPGVNRSRIRDPALDKKAEQFMAETDPAKAQKLSQEMQIEVAKNAYWVMMPNYFEYAAIQPWLRNYRGYGIYQNPVRFVEELWMER